MKTQLSSGRVAKVMKVELSREGGRRRWCGFHASISTREGS
jgi:hypothetical protein